MGVLHAFHPSGWWFQASGARPGWLHGEFESGLFPGMPWFLDDLRPQGFMGRAFARTHGVALGLRPDPTTWSAEDVLIAVLLRGEDLPGDFIVGDHALERAQRLRLAPPVAIPAGDRPRRYAELAARSVAGDMVGSSAGGEQPKFTARASDEGGERRAVIVKFSDSADSPIGRRWADLLLAEHLASEVLREHGVPSARSEIVYAAGRCCLEVTRFDRVGAHGRGGFASLAALDADYYGQYDTWADAADRLERDGWSTRADADHLRVLWWFGGLIANTDRHFGNVGMTVGEGRPLALAPAFDMLPMLYRPAATGEIVERVFDPPLAPPRASAEWSHAAVMAVTFWRKVADDARVSGTFRETAGKNVDVIEARRS